MTAAEQLEARLARLERVVAFTAGAQLGVPAYFSGPMSAEYRWARAASARDAAQIVAEQQKLLEEQLEEEQRLERLGAAR